MDELTLFDVADDGTIIYHDEADENEEVLDWGICGDGHCYCNDLVQQ